MALIDVPDGWIVTGLETLLSRDRRIAELEEQLSRVSVDRSAIIEECAVAARGAEAEAMRTFRTAGKLPQEGEVRTVRQVFSDGVWRSVGILDERGL